MTRQIVLRLAITLATLCLGAFASSLAIWPAWIHMLREKTAMLPWTTGTWQSYVVDATGKMIPAANGPFIVSCIFGLMVLALAGMFAGRTGEGASAAAQPSGESQRLPESAEKQLAAELATIINLIRSHLQASGSFSDSLAQAKKDLPAAVKPEQLRMIVNYLVAENEKMRGKTADLQSNLEKSRSQIDALRSNLAEARELGLKDPLTSLGNRRCFDQSLVKEIIEAHSKKSALSLVLGDIDHFKKINDSFGHRIGDEVLKLFAKLLANTVRERDTLARYGGEEFAIIMPETNKDGAIHLAEQIAALLKNQNWSTNGGKQPIGKVTASFGVAQLSDNDSSETLVQRADAKLYQAKAGGRNRIVS